MARDLCLDQVKAGMAWHYKQYQDEQSAADREAYGAAECAAMKAKVGLWGDSHPVQPQDFRHGTSLPRLYDASGCRRSSEPSSRPLVGNGHSHIFEWPGCPYYRRYLTRQPRSAGGRKRRDTDRRITVREGEIKLCGAFLVRAVESQSLVKESEQSHPKKEGGCKAALVTRLTDLSRDYHACPWRSSLPEVAPVHFPSENVSAPFTIIER
jgi:Staphylococcal nuclease homologue